MSSGQISNKRHFPEPGVRSQERQKERKNNQSCFVCYNKGQKALDAPHEPEVKKTMQTPRRRRRQGGEINAHISEWHSGAKPWKRSAMIHKFPRREQRDPLQPGAAASISIWKEKRRMGEACRWTESHSPWLSTGDGSVPFLSSSGPKRHISTSNMFSNSLNSATSCFMDSQLASGDSLWEPLWRPHSRKWCLWPFFGSVARMDGCLMLQGPSETAQVH